MTPEGIRSNLVNMTRTSLNPLFDPAAGASPTSPTNTTRKTKKGDKAEQLMPMFADNQQSQQPSQIQLTTIVRQLSKVKLNALTLNFRFLFRVVESKIVS